MSAKRVVPMQVLSEALAEKIDGRRVRSALFTTFTFNPGFFELDILPTLFDQPFSPAEKLRRIQLEDALRALDSLAVYYDRTALAQDAQPAQLDYRRIDVRRATGVFHPKVILILVERPPTADELEEGIEEPTRSLIVAVGSANLTRAGWWENVECVHFEEITEASGSDNRCPFRPDLLSLVRRIRGAAASDDDHSALDAMHAFIRDDAPAERVKRASTGGRFYTRLFYGQQQKSLTDWLADLRLQRRDWNLEVVSPFFDSGGAGPLEDLLGLLRPRETRVYLPRDTEGAAEVSRETYDAIAAQPATHWAALPSDIMNRGRGKSGDKLPPRRVHGKLYRLWSKDSGDVLILGSPNLTWSAHSRVGAGNLEAAFLVDVSDEGFPRRWWLERLESEPKRFSERNPSEADGLENVPVDVSLRFDWSNNRLGYRLGGDDCSPFTVCEVTGHRLFDVPCPRPDGWQDLPEAPSLREVLRATSFLEIQHPKGRWRVLVREENMSWRPSILHELTPEEILRYWALLTPAQRAEFLEEHVGRQADLEGIPLARADKLGTGDTMFDRFAGIYHAFGCLRRSVAEAVGEGRYHEAETRLFGAKYDSLPHLLEKTLERNDGDSVVRYVTFLCAQQLYDHVRTTHRELIEHSGAKTKTLDAMLERLPEVRADVPLDGVTDGQAFLSWVEQAFLESPGQRS